MTKIQTLKIKYRRDTHQTKGKMKIDTLIQNLLQIFFCPGLIPRTNFCFYILYLIYLRIPQQGSNPDQGGLLSSYKRK